MPKQFTKAELKTIAIALAGHAVYFEDVARKARNDPARAEQFRAKAAQVTAISDKAFALINVTTIADKAISLIEGD